MMCLHGSAELKGRAPRLLNKETANWYCSSKSDNLEHGLRLFVLGLSIYTVYCCLQDMKIALLLIWNATVARTE